MIRYVEEIVREVCTEDRVNKLVAAGMNTSGNYAEMEKFLTDRGFGLPVRDKSMSFVFCLNHKYMYSFFNYADCLAEEILLLYRLKMI